jgi:hypothetical protein
VTKAVEPPDSRAMIERFSVPVGEALDHRQLYRVTASVTNAESLLCARETRSR